MLAMALQDATPAAELALHWASLQHSQAAQLGAMAAAVVPCTLLFKFKLKQLPDRYLH